MPLRFVYGHAGVGRAGEGVERAPLNIHLLAKGVDDMKPIGRQLACSDPGA